MFFDYFVIKIDISDAEKTNLWLLVKRFLHLSMSEQGESNVGPHFFIFIEDVVCFAFY